MVRYCSICAQETEFEQPPCVDGHGADCPEFVCVSCGAAVFVGTVPAEVDVRTETRHVA